MTSEEGFSIIVCCYNSAARLPATLKHISSLSNDEQVPIEVIVVDNNCQDDTAEVASCLWHSELGNPFDLVIVKESKPGLSFAREKGVTSSRYSYGIFCDDDNWLDVDYLETALNIFRAQPDVGVIGGVSYPEADEEFPAWFFSRARSFAVGIQAEEDGNVTRNHWLWGAGMVFRVEVLKAIYASGVKSLITDRSGSSLTSGGDNEICAWFIFKGYELWFDKALKLKHHMASERLTNEYYRRFFSGSYPTAWPVYSALLDFLVGSSGDLNVNLTLAQKLERKFKSSLLLIRKFRVLISVLALRRRILEV